MEKNLIDHYKPRLIQHGGVLFLAVFRKEDSV